jgi:oligopeptide/dipeptide ABC transporter ATP-binding protein
MMKLRDLPVQPEAQLTGLSTIAPTLHVTGDQEFSRIVVNLSVRDLVVSFPSYGRKNHRALDHVSLEVRHGEIIGLVGESGSGKTTLARAIMGMVPQPGAIESGEVLFRGVSMTKLDIDALRKIRGRSISMMVPNPRSELNPLQTVGQQIANVAHQHLGGSRKDAAQKAMDMLRAVRIPDAERRFNAYPHELSGGMAQRVIIAIALICSPQFIISDDATSGLDVTVQAQVLDLMKVLVRDQNASMLFITRDIGIAAHFCNRVAVMYGGEIVEFGDTDGFFGRPAHPYSIMLLAAFSHNPALRRRWIKDGSANQSRAETGCPFRLRCVRAQPRCEAEHPVLRPLKSGHEVRCHFPVEAIA